MAKIIMNLKQWRKANKLTQKEVAEAMGCESAMTICYWEKRGVKNTDTIDKLKKLSKNKINDFGGEE